MLKSATAVYNLQPGPTKKIPFVHYYGRFEVRKLLQVGSYVEIKPSNGDIMLRCRVAGFSLSLSSTRVKDEDSSDIHQVRYVEMRGQSVVHH